ncbi:hypothetical protein TcCL_Unassigned03305 [Trypanosoma cruzi]|nr:hypothetical protein TcCL_Unassigned03305 [Trypanosoma cruzi]
MQCSREFEQSCYFYHAALLHILFLRFFTCSASFFTSLPGVSAGTHKHTHTECKSQWIWMVLLRCVWQLRVGAAFSRGHEAKGGSGALRVTAWSEAARRGWMRNRFCVCGSLGDCSLRVRCVLAAGLWPYPVGRGIELEAMVALGLFCSSMVGGCWRCVRLLCGGPNPLTRGLTALRWCVCVCEVWCGVAGQCEGRGGAFPETGVCFFCVFVLLLAFPSSPSPLVFLRGVAACSRAVLIVSAS